MRPHMYTLNTPFACHTWRVTRLAANTHLRRPSQGRPACAQARRMHSCEAPTPGSGMLARDGVGRPAHAHAGPKAAAAGPLSPALTPPSYLHCLHSWLTRVRADGPGTRLTYYPHTTRMYICTGCFQACLRCNAHATPTFQILRVTTSACVDPPRQQGSVPLGPASVYSPDARRQRCTALSGVTVQAVLYMLHCMCHQPVARQCRPMPVRPLPAAIMTKKGATAPAPLLRPAGIPQPETKSRSALA